MSASSIKKTNTRAHLSFSLTLGSAAAYNTPVHMSSFKSRALADILITTPMDRRTTCSRSAGRTGHSTPSSVSIIPKVDITAKLSVFLPPVYRNPESRRRDRIRRSPDLRPFSYPGSCPSLSGDRSLAFNKTTTL